MSGGVGFLARIELVALATVSLIGAALVAPVPGWRLTREPIARGLQSE